LTHDFGQHGEAADEARNKANDDLAVGEVERVRHHEEPEQIEGYADDDTHGVILHLLKHAAGSWSGRDLSWNLLSACYNIRNQLPDLMNKPLTWCCPGKRPSSAALMGLPVEALAKTGNREAGLKLLVAPSEKTQSRQPRHPAPGAIACAMNFESFLDRGRLYVIGDIHGRSDLLDRMIAAISGDLETNPIEECVTVTLGDYIDRGPDSRGVLDRLIKNPFPTKFIALKGNHELMFESFLRDPSVADQWRRFGGLETLMSYGVPVGSLMLGKNYEQAAEALKAAVPQSHLEFLSALRTSLSVGQYFLCHAGIRPGVALERQSADDLLWIRGPFLDSRADFGKIIVHGHTPAEKPEVLANRINIDTGAYMTNRLTCVALGREPVRFLSTAS
jgi:serine/threonine protein phosphatase 1